MDHIIVDEFLDSASCEELIEAATHYCPKELGVEMHGGRNFIPFSSVHWRRLLKHSTAWRSLHIRLQSQEFLDWIVEELAPPGCDQDLRSTTCYGKRRSWLASRIQEERRMRTASDFTFFRGGKLGKFSFSILIRFLDQWMNIRRKIIYYRQRFSGGTAVELLYDYSRASDGYFREIHRDSDLRRYVFLLYLNQLDEESEGGDLRIYKLRNPEAGFPGRPREEDCVLVQSYPPKAGRLVVFRNTSESYHSTGKMNGHSQERNFLYGGITQLGGTNPNMRLALDDMPTEFGLYP